METRSLSNRDLSEVRVLSGWRLYLAWALWGLVVLGALAYFLLSLPLGYQEYSESPRWALGYVDVLASLQISPFIFASFLIFVEALALLPSFIYTALVLMRRSNDWLVLLVTATVILLPITASFSVYQNENPFGGLVFGMASLSILATLLLFPDGHFVPKWGRWLLLFSIPVYILSGFSFSGLMRGEQITGLETILLLSGQSLAFLVGIGAQIYRFRYVSQAVQRQQTKWLIMGMLLFLAMIIVFVILQFFPALRVPSLNPDGVIYDLPSLIMVIIFVPLLTIAITFIPISMGMAVIQFRLWDIDLALNRSLVYVVQIVSLLALFGVFFFVIQVILGTIFGSTQDNFALMISAGLVAAAFNPVRMQTRHFIDRNLFGLRFDLNELKAVEKREILNPGLMTGSIIQDYEVMDVIGRGGMGEVYRAEKQGHRVAIKTMLIEVAANPDLRQRFLNESAAGRRLQHPHIAKVLGSGEHEGTPYLVLEYIEGRDLKQILQAQGKIPEQQVLSILEHISDALDHSHQMGFVHRDIKPANIMFQDNGKAVLMDFGVTKIADSDASLTGTSAIGTIDYMSPEQIVSAKEIDGRADIYALGIVCYEILTGQKPFQGSAAQVMFAHLQQPPPDPRDDLEVSRPLAKAIMKAMEKDPEDRFNTASAFLQAALGKIAID